MFVGSTIDLIYRFVDLFFGIRIGQVGRLGQLGDCCDATVTASWKPIGSAQPKRWLWICRVLNSAKMSDSEGDSKEC